ncbi:hypothetical protein M413DRAFT_282260 [Hebeloma cylindrosporum]|uniref:Uncharacterized protein n=1 Tax=Hebeloma cylindrosporum TaxID=76867 RepID=A0A0C2Y7A5_HEBCY|nr:hypothetical protein M413DRAFT_282260 [Hebeloma cylindrosporum h7]
MATQSSRESQTQTGPVHFLSKKSLARRRDIFLFAHEPGITFRMLGGLSSQMHPDLTIASFYRWLDILDNAGPEEPFDVWRINVAKIGILSYTATRVGEPLDRESTCILQPGDYGAYCKGV